MVDSINNKKSSPHSSNVDQTLRKNFKNISSPTESSFSDQFTKTINNLSASVKNSADAINSLNKVYQNSPVKFAEVAAANLSSAQTSLKDVDTASENAEKTGSAIQYDKDSALSAHGDNLDSGSVQRLLNN
ncbi:MAG: hypothetical protein KBC84_07590 [Proteobacteria bacterium]|nr:hypothetical protein [Pseudomonadota bacterium]